MFKNRLIKDKKKKNSFKQKTAWNNRIYKKRFTKYWFLKSQDWLMFWIGPSPEKDPCSCNF